MEETQVNSSHHEEEYKSVGLLEIGWQYKINIPERETVEMPNMNTR